MGNQFEFGTRRSFIELKEDGTKTPLEEKRIGLLEQDNSVLSILRVRISDLKGFLNGTQLRFEHPVKRTPLAFRADQATDYGNGDYYWTGLS